METMETADELGSLLRGEDAEARREAARMMGRARSEKKAAASRENGKKGGVRVVTEEHREKLRLAQTARRERERQERAALASSAAPVKEQDAANG